MFLEHGREVAPSGEQRGHVHLLARHAHRQREALAHGVPRAALQAVLLRQEVEVLHEQGVAVLDGDLGEAQALAFPLHVLGVAHGHGQDGGLPHLRDECGAGMDLGRLSALAAARALGQNAHDLVVLQHARCALDGSAVGGVALDGERAHTREDLPHQAVGIVEQALTAHEAQPLLRARCQVHERHIKKRGVVRHHHHAALLVETADALAVVHTVAEAYLEHEHEESPDKVACPVGSLLLVGRAAKGHVPYLLVRENQAHRTALSRASSTMSSMTSSM